MTHTTPPPLPTLIPETAPFSPQQRTWLNGFLIGLLSLDGGINPLTAAESAALVPAVGSAPESRGALTDGDDGQASVRLSDFKRSIKSFRSDCKPPLGYPKVCV
jgi:sulfite reductase (NADPH) flavoprotein alpha-component